MARAAAEVLGVGEVMGKEAMARVAAGTPGEAMLAGGEVTVKKEAGSL